MSTTASSPSCRPSSPTEARFAGLVGRAQACQACPAMAGRRRVLGCDNGPVPARMLLVGEAPGRLGAQRSGVPFSGDESGRRLDALLDAAGWTRGDLFITNAVLCNPLDHDGHNRPPTAREVANCSGWLEATIDLVDPLLVVALGAVALRALARIEAHPLTLAGAGQPPVAWHGRRLAALYHPGRRALLHRAQDQQLRDIRALAEWLEE